MNKFFAIIIAFGYLTASSGAIVNLHYCMGKLISLDFSEQQKGMCSNCGMHKKEQKGCCRDEHKILQIDKDQKISQSAYKFLRISSDATKAIYAELPLAYPSSILSENPGSHSPPPVTNLPIFILHCNFRI
jgi:hypothetical protein